MDGRGRSPGSRRTQFRRGPDPRRAVRKGQRSGRVPWLLKAMRRVLDRPESKDWMPAEKTCRRLLEETVAKLEKARANAERPKPSRCGLCQGNDNRYLACGQCQDALRAWESERRAWGVTQGPGMPSPESNSKPVASPPPVRQPGRPPRRWQTPLTKTPLTPADRAAIEARIRDAYDYSGND
jgi:hypothetical protein